MTNERTSILQYLACLIPDQQKPVKNIKKVNPYDYLK